MIRRDFLDSLFPPRYDFYGMLTRQTELTAQGILAFVTWLRDPSPLNLNNFQRLIDDADMVRMKLEEELIEAFTTPFDREDIYTFSVRMDRILEFAKAALLSVQAYSIAVDQALIAMAENLALGTGALVKGTSLLEKEPQNAGMTVDAMRKSYLAMQNAYRESLAAIFQGDNAMEALKLCEVYHAIREAANAFDLVVDVFHRIIVRLI